MKIIIEIPEKTNAHIRSDYGHFVTTGAMALRAEDKDILCYAVYHGEPYNDRPRGDWISRRDKFGIHLYSVCSECNVAHNYTDFPNFCPNCGSDNRPRKGGET